MTYKDYSEAAQIEYTLAVTVNGEAAGLITAYGEPALLEDMRKIDHAIEKELEKQFGDLPENLEAEAAKEKDDD